jgi:hypothetical protein
MRIKMVTVSWRWPSGKLQRMSVPNPVLANIYRALKDDNRIGNLGFEDLTYKHYVQAFGGQVVDRFIRNPNISPMVIIAPLLLAAGTLTYFIIKGKVKPKPAPASQSEAIQRILKFLPVGSKFWGSGNAMPTPLAQLPAGYRYSSSQGTMTEAGTLWFIIPTGGS